MNATLNLQDVCDELVTTACRLTSMRVIETVHAEQHDLIDSPCYRVNFWVQPHAGYAWSLDAYALIDVADITEVLRWVGEHANGRRFEVFAEIEVEPEGSFGTPRKTGLVRLLGSNPNDGETVEVILSKSI